MEKVKEEAHPSAVSDKIAMASGYPSRLKSPIRRAIGRDSQLVTSIFLMKEVLTLPDSKLVYSLYHDPCSLASLYYNLNRKEPKKKDEMNYQLHDLILCNMLGLKSLSYAVTKSVFILTILTYIDGLSEHYLPVKLLFLAPILE